MNHMKWIFVFYCILPVLSAADPVDDPRPIAKANCDKLGGTIGAEKDGPLCSTVYLPVNCGIGSYTAIFPCTKPDGTVTDVEVLAKCCCCPCEGGNGPPPKLLCRDVSPNYGKLPFDKKNNLAKPICKDPCPNYKLINRKGWGARAPKKVTPFPKLPTMVIIHHTDGAIRNWWYGACTSEGECKSRIESIQDDHMDDEGWDDIGYNFLVGEDGNAYEGRGWNNVGAHAGNLADNQKSIGIAFIGYFENRVPNDKAICAFRKLVASGVKLKKLPAKYVKKGHKDVKKTTDCPGAKLHALIPKL